MRNLVAACALVLTLTVIPSVVAGGDIQIDGKFVSTESTNPPLEVSSTAMVPNLNADLVDGHEASYFVKVNQTTSVFSAVPSWIYVSGSDGKLPDNVVDDGSIDDVTRRIFFGCNQLDPGYLPNGPSMDYLGLTPALAFGKVSGEDPNGIILATLVPDDWDEASGFDIRVFWATNALDKDVVWYVASSAKADDEDLTTGTYASYEILIGYGSSTQFGQVRSGPVTIDPGNLARGDLLSIWIRRDGDHDRDTLATDAYLVGVEISYVAVR